ncbi:DUF4209 domain-containing protein [Belliella aquatica]|uniref:DUF4209 domain-containing protein n=1 Tax=Belliella aquatica TaxID=1323734 RepID=A0ABQ1N2I9_9BACT|nr:DUF4209 domain-containing protein [Belliella aquatica]MCH7407097.1 DUF4209 domain-containing protein [Belliella aquatica]GGC52206.1 hypothetical protein GCM10010993_33350 [Belliella aquatica]
MKAKEIDISKFSSIVEFNDFFDASFLELGHNRSRIKSLVKFRDQVHLKLDKEKAQFEIDYAIFDFERQEFFPLLSKASNKPEKVCSYENLTVEAKKEFDYLLERANSSTNTLFKAHYFHLLWRCPSKLRRREYAEKAIAYYFLGLDEVLRKLRSVDDEFILNLIGNQFSALVALTSDIKTETSNLERVFKDLLENNTNIPFYEKDHLITIALKKPKILTKESFKVALNVYEKEFFEIGKTDDSLLIEYHYIPNAKTLCKKLGLSERKWINLQGEFHLNYVKTQKKNSWFLSNYLRKAISCFKASKNEILLSESETLFREIKKKVNLPTRRVLLTREKNKGLFECRDQSIALAKELISIKSSEIIFLRIIGGVDYPSAKQINDNYQKLYPDFFRTFTTIFFDINNNPMQGADDIDLQFMKMKLYQLELDFMTLPYLDTIIEEGIKNKTLTAEEIISFITEKTWIGHPFTVSDSDDEAHELSWIPLISPSIKEYFNQRIIKIENPDYKTDFILCIDSLTTKFEGLIRYFLEQREYSISKTVTTRVEQMNLNNLLESEGFKKLFNQDDQLLFEYLFSGNGGLDIRNNVAHCFYHDGHYTSDKMLLLISALLRLGKYTFSSREDK